VAHVRAASVGEVSEANCHPFQYKELLLAHNGGVEHFSRIKRSLRSQLSDELYNWIKGQTDSEHIFAFLINRLISDHPSITPDSVTEAFEFTFSYIKQLMSNYEINEDAYLNMVITNGHFIVATRYVTNSKEEPLTLYHSEGSRYVVENGITRMEAPKDNDQAVLVVSEKLTNDNHWTLIPKNHFVIVEPDLNVRIKPIKA
jgi:predicted glutamine amidotransferase